MSLTRARSLILSTFIAGLALQLLTVTLTYVKGEISSKDVGTLTVKLLGIYSVQMAIILGSIFGQHKSSARIAHRWPFQVALILSILWNLLLLWRTTVLYFATANHPAGLVSHLHI